MCRVIFFAVFCLLSLGSLAYATEFPDCGSEVGSFSEIRISGCDKSSETCDLIRDTNASIEIDFTPLKDVTEVKAVVFGVISDVPIPFPLPQANACEYADSGLTCPLSKNTLYTYKTSMYIKKIYPKLKLQIKIELLDEEGKKIVCAIIPARIKSA